MLSVWPPTGKDGEEEGDRRAVVSREPLPVPEIAIAEAIR